MSAIAINGNTTTAVQANFSFYKGEDVAISDTMSPATAIAGWSLQFTVRKKFGDATALVTKTTGAGITITDSVNGVFKITLAGADTAGLDLTAYVYDIQRIDSGSRTVLTIGNMTLLPEVAL